MEHSDHKSMVLKYAGLLGIAVPLLGAIVTASFQYRQFVLENRDNNFRQVVDKLASEKAEERQASVTNLGIYLKDPAYKEQTLDILVNMTAIELNTNVLSAIRSSLEKLGTAQDRKLIIQNLLLQGTSIFAWSEAMKEWSRKTTKELNDGYIQFQSDLASLTKEHNISIDKVPVSLIADINNLEEKSKAQSQATRQYSEIAIHEEIIAGFIKSLLDNSAKNAAVGLEFFQNSINYQAIINAKLVNPKIINSAISRSTLDNFEVVGSDTENDGATDCTIHNTTFQYTNILNSSFINCDIKKSLFAGDIKDGVLLTNTSFVDSSFEDVFFYRANLAGADFSGVDGLKAEYFYGAMNYESATFSDEGFIAEITAMNATPDKFLDFLYHSTLSSQRYRAICEDVQETEGITCRTKI